VALGWIASPASDLLGSGLDTVPLTGVPFVLDGLESGNTLFSSSKERSMPPQKFKGSLEDLQTAVATAGIAGSWNEEA
jgi:hypothetical protein